MFKVMENYLRFSLLGNKFLNFFSEFSYVILSIVLIFSALVFLLIALYKKLRKKFPLVVNCWFCNTNSSVPYELSNAWECPHCKQYNGFNEDGDYNKIIPEQYNYTLNELKFKALRTSLEHSETKSQSNGLCKSCNINQQLKIQQLALFVPLSENNYYKEIEEYREKLEKAYQLCFKCERILQETLEKQGYELLQNRLNSSKHIAPSQKSKIFTQLDRDNTFILIKKFGILGLKTIQTLSAILLFLAILIHFETESPFLSSALPDLAILEPLSSVFKVLLYCENRIYSIKWELSLTGVICCFLITLQSKTTQNCLNSLAWGFLHLSLWSAPTQLQLLTSGICLFSSLQGKKNKFIHFNKKSLPKKTGFQPVKQVFSDSCNTLGAPSRIFSPLIKRNVSASRNGDVDSFENKKIKETKQKLRIISDGEAKKWEKQNENELESLPNEEKEKLETKSVNLSPKRKSFSPSAEAERNCGESSGPVNEVYDILNGLQLGGKQKKSNKPPNFLFANHNFSDSRSASSIIKPAKFIKNLNSTSWTDSNECNSRSSTPSSGYFSQKPEKVEPVRYEFPKAITPVSVNPFSRPGPGHYFDYCEGNHGFLNNINCYSPGYVPFQHFSGPFGHTAVYTCTRPTSFPFPFSPYQGLPSQKFSPSSPRFSDSSDCDNLFQESSKRFSRNSRCVKLKTILYYFSVFLNFTTMLSLLYFTSTGIISIDWKLPRLNFIF